MRRVLALLAAVFACLFAFEFARVNQPNEKFQGRVLIDIPRRMNTREIASLLAKQGVIADPLQFLFVRAIHPRARLQAGEYEFSKPMTAAEVFDRIARGDVHYYEVRVPEGSNLWDVARTVGELGFISAAEFEAAARDRSLIGDLAPNARTLEGFLFPSTYRVTRHTTAHQLAKMMVDQFRTVWTKLGAKTDANSVVTLASLVEKETGNSEERPIVASVFQNRLNQGIKLDCDPTTIYAALLQGRYRGTIYRSDLDNQHPYNTYQHTGLPPGPIANPGQAAIEAALHPAQTGFLYFVAKPGGETHNFSATQAEHVRYVAEYRRGQQKPNPKAAVAAVTGKPKATSR